MIANGKHRIESLERRTRQRDQGRTYVLISRELAVVATMSTRVGVLYLGEFLEIGNCDDVTGHARRLYTQAFIASSESRVDMASGTVSEIPSAIDLPASCRVQSPCPHATQRCQQGKPVLGALSASYSVACQYDFTALSATTGSRATQSVAASYRPVQI